MPVGQNRGYDGVPERHPDPVEHARMLARAVNRLSSGKFNGTLDVTLRASQTTTPLSDPRLAATSVILWMPRSANASVAEKAGLWVSDRRTGAAILNHAAAAASDQDFTLLIVG
jgi:hypothetical protein